MGMYRFVVPSFAVKGIVILDFRLAHQLWFPLIGLKTFFSAPIAASNANAAAELGTKLNSNSR
jgi:hypothetical protein